MKLLWLTWKDQRNPLAGGAETVNEEIAKRLVAAGHQVKLIVGGFVGAEAVEVRDGYEIIRVGDKWSVYWKTYRYYRKNLEGWADLVIEEVNTVPFFAKFYVREPNMLLIHMLCREIWFYQLPLPLSLLGWLVEPLYLMLLNDRKVITISQSTKNDLIKRGFKAVEISIISLGIPIQPLDALIDNKYAQPTLLSLGSIRPMKRTLDQLRAFEIAKLQIPALRLIVAGGGEGAYARMVLRMMRDSAYAKDIEFRGRVSEMEKRELMEQCQLLLVTSIKEGWGLVVTEAASQGTPSVAYDVDGLRDSVQGGKTGVITKRNAKDLAAGIVNLLSNSKEYEKLRIGGWEVSRKLTFDQSYQNFINIISL